MKNETFQGQYMAKGASRVTANGHARAKSIARALSKLGIVDAQTIVTPHSAAWQLLAASAPGSNYNSAKSWLATVLAYIEKCDELGIAHPLGLLQTIMEQGPGSIQAVGIEPGTLATLVASTEGVTMLSPYGMQDGEGEPARMFIIPRETLERAHQVCLENLSRLN